MRLIDADQIESTLRYAGFDRDKKVGWLEAYRHFMQMIENAPTAYDVDKVVNRLRYIQIKSNSSEFDFGIDKAIEVIKIELNK